MKPSEIGRALETAIAIRQPTIVWGPVGIGKSMVTAQVGTALGRRVIDVRAPQLDAVDLRGIPQVANGVTRWCPPGFLPTAADGPTLLFLDELNRAPAMVQNALLQLVLDRKIGEYVLPDTCEIVSACNRMSDGGGVQKMTSALANRFTHLPMEADLDDWCRWAVQSDIEPCARCKSARKMPRKPGRQPSYGIARSRCRRKPSTICRCSADPCNLKRSRTL